MVEAATQASADFYTVAQVAKRLHLSEKMIYKLCDENVLGHSRFGAAIRITEEQLAAYVAKSTSPPKK